MGSIKRAFMRIVATRRYISVTSFETETSGGRASERYRRAALTAIAAGGARSISLVALLVSVPVALGYLGPERYGVVITITALAAMLIFADFGLGNGLMNLVATARASGSDAGVRRSISSAFFMLLALTGVMSSLFVLLHAVVPWAQLLNQSRPSDVDEVSASVAVFLGCVALNLPFGMVQRVQFAYQEGYITSAWSAIGSLVGLVCLFAAIELEAALPWIVLTLVGGQLFANILNSVYFFGFRRPDLRPSWGSAHAGEGVRLARLGMLFFVLQLTVAVAYQSDVVVATAVIGPHAATDYSVTHRLFMVVPQILGMLFLPMWPAYSDALARRDTAWVRRTVRASALASFIVTAIVSAGLVIAGPTLLHMWVGDDATAEFPLLVGMGAWAVLNATFSAIAMLFNAAAVMRFQIVSAFAMGVTSLGASIILANVFGVAGVIWGTVVAHLACSALPSMVFLPRLLRKIAADGD